MSNALFNPLPTFRRTFAAWPVWAYSTKDEVIFEPMPKKQAVRLYQKAREWNRNRRAGHYGGALGSTVLRVLESLLFDFLNFATGRLDPSYDAIARKTGLGRSTVAAALARLKQYGILHWLRRCTEDRDERGGFTLRQLTNAYAILPVSQWRGYVPPPEPVVHPTSWGAVPPLPDAIQTASQDLGQGASNREAINSLYREAPSGSVAEAIACLFKHVPGGKA